ncbi:MAG: protein-L-isoaspartate(D-aspartate) O-methyltransferase [Candidatus Nanohaloarchaeota archaeon QJJ-7]|nr:protein-L-isoaspartate(D-aspartate) O-methyltransferase [Candidatus Nanohaloarchaeota archaeon QJJ-7]
MGNRVLVDRLKRKGVLESERVIDAFLDVPREDFVPTDVKDKAYEDRPLSIGEGQTISAPHMVAVMTEELEPEEDDKVLEIGTGSGYQAAILSRLVDELITTEIVPELAEGARRRLSDYEDVKVVEADGSIGYEKEAPYDKILYTAAAPEIAPEVFDQLKEGGRLVAPVESGFGQRLKVYRRKDSDIDEEAKSSVRFVPLTGEAGKNTE